MEDQQSRDWQQDDIMCDGHSADNLDRVILQPCALVTYLETVYHVSGTAWSSDTSETPSGQAPHQYVQRYRILQKSEFPDACGGFSDVYRGICADISPEIGGNGTQDVSKVRLSCYRRVLPA
jgi:hypothetical protein